MLFTLLLGIVAMTVMAQDILRLPPPPPGEKITYGNDPFQFAELRLPEGSGPHPVVVVIHGGFWRAAYNLDHIGHLCVELNRSGLATWSLEYRRIGNSGGGWPGTFQDISSGIDHLRAIAPKFKLDLDRVVVIGHSAGGHLALWAAARRNLPQGIDLIKGDPLPVRGVVSLAGVADLRQGFELKLSNTVVADLLGGSPELVSERYRMGSPRELLPLRVPQRLIHGTLDTNVPIEISRDYATAAAARGDDAVFIPLEGARHFELIDPRAKEFEAVRQAVLELLK
jgi:acetyl esterase/lipase